MLRYRDGAGNGRHTCNQGMTVGGDAGRSVIAEFVVNGLGRPSASQASSASWGLILRAGQRGPAPVSGGQPLVLGELCLPRANRPVYRRRASEKARGNFRFRSTLRDAQ
jgi:hypothetical protein